MHNTPKISLWLAPLSLSVCMLTSVARAGTGADGLTFFEQKIRPILVDNCYRCHSADAKAAGKLKGELYLDTRDGVLKGGEDGPALVPGKVEESKLIKAVRYSDPDTKMPPKKQLTAEQVADLEKWVAMGAPDPRTQTSPAPAAKPLIDLEAGRKHWAFRPLEKIDPPAVQHDYLARNPIDRFILSKIEEKSLLPNAPASRTVLIRRAYADLVGLPPTPEAVDDFVKDPSSDAWEKLIDRLLASDHYGERWGRHWLDIVRFGESNGYEFDADRKGAYQYRDFVIRAFNQDMPYDQFVRWQIAGDKLLPGNYDAAAATGFIVAGPSPGQITVKTAEPLRYDQLDDMISTLGNSMLGLTVGCCRCHDHKYDPLPQKDYYRLASCFADTDSSVLKVDAKPEAYQKTIADWVAAGAPVRADWERYARERLPSRAESWRLANPEAPPAQWLVPEADRAEATIFALGDASDVVPLKKQPDNSLRLTGKTGRRQMITVAARTNLKHISQIRLEGFTDKSKAPESNNSGVAGVQFLLNSIDVTATPIRGKEKPVKVKLKPVVVEPAKTRGDFVAGPLSWSPQASGKDATKVYTFDKPVGFDGGTELTFTLAFNTGQPMLRSRFSIATAEAPAELQSTSSAEVNAEIAAILDESHDQVTPDNAQELGRWMREVDPEVRRAYAALDDYMKKEPKEPVEPIFSAGMKPGRPVYFLARGDTNAKNGLASPGFVQVLMTAPEKDDHWTVANSAAPGAGPATKPAVVHPRLALARWITDTQEGGGQLLARVIVNRLWQHHMGRGIVATPNDFGLKGDAPTQPEMLEWLAGELIHDGWRIKPMQKLIMTSAVYMQDGAATPASVAADPENKLWWRHPAQRLEAEAVRDTLLSISGSLDPTMFGPGSLDETTLRRSVYLTVKRSKAVPFMQVFDAPEASQSIGERQVTTVATQALTLMNSPFVRQRAEQLAKRVRSSPGVELSEAVRQTYRLAYCRPATDDEVARMVGFIQRQARTYKSKGEENALVDFCQVMLCSDEFVYVD